MEQVTCCSNDLWSQNWRTLKQEGVCPGWGNELTRVTENRQTCCCMCQKVSTSSHATSSTSKQHTACWDCLELLQRLTACLELPRLENDLLATHSSQRTLLHYGLTQRFPNFFGPPPPWFHKHTHSAPLQFKKKMRFCFHFYFIFKKLSE
jgi:hypothetical protein